MQIFAQFATKQRQQSQQISDSSQRPQPSKVMTITFPFHPHGPTTADLRQNLPLSNVENLLSEIYYERLIIGWNKAPTIRQILGGTKRLSLTPDTTDYS